jgi:hypothetical protein
VNAPPFGATFLLVLRIHQPDKATDPADTDLGDRHRVRRILAEWRARVALGTYAPRAPTDPGVRDYRTRLFKKTDSLTIGAASACEAKA